jgi:hypothetical protein
VLTARVSTAAYLLGALRCAPYVFEPNGSDLSNLEPALSESEGDGSVKALRGINDLASSIASSLRRSPNTTVSADRHKITRSSSGEAL